jgi:hypothetical protein
MLAGENRSLASVSLTASGSAVVPPQACSASGQCFILISPRPLVAGDLAARGSGSTSMLGGDSLDALFGYAPMHVDETAAPARAAHLVARALAAAAGAAVGGSPAAAPLAAAAVVPAPPVGAQQTMEHQPTGFSLGGASHRRLRLHRVLESGVGFPFSTVAEFARAALCPQARRV